MRARQLGYLAVCVAALFASPIVASASEIAVDFNFEKEVYYDLGEPDLDDVAGFTFIVGAEDIFITHLGFYDLGRRGLGDPHPVGIYDVESEELVVSTTVPSGTSAKLDGQFRFVRVATTKLTAGKQYVILGYRPPNSDVICYDCEELFVAPFVTYHDQVALNGSLEAPLGGLVFTT